MSNSIVTAAKITIWRDEVDLSPKYCVCSEPTIRPRPALTIPPPTTASSGIAAKQAECFVLPPLPEFSYPSSINSSSVSPTIQTRTSNPRNKSSSDSSRPTDSLDDSAKGRDRAVVANAESKNDSLTCAICNGLLVDVNGASAQPGRAVKEGSACKWSSPRVEPDPSSELPRAIRPIAGWYGTLRRCVSKLGAAEKPGNKFSAFPEEGKSTATRALKRSLSKLFKGKTAMSSPEVGGTEMYSLYHSSGSESRSIRWSLSDGEYRRPKLAIDESAARLRRARKLLEMSNKRLP
ncbi:hypothetical protein GGR52DRAFT_349143 [Hypoxylon sp. FL1284]|nr:hypothetical protein GGR52DRAFT_349143 [Hypoxylon sp. FL1284]